MAVKLSAKASLLWGGPLIVLVSFAFLQLSLSLGVGYNIWICFSGGLWIYMCVYIYNTIGWVLIVWLIIYFQDQLRFVFKFKL